MDDLDHDVEEVIVACEGDLKAAIRVLIVANRTIEEALRNMEAATLKGYRRKVG